jgi:hypothetical protein
MISTPSLLSLHENESALVDKQQETVRECVYVGYVAIEVERITEFEFDVGIGSYFGKQISVFHRGQVDIGRYIVYVCTRDRDSTSPNC